MYYFNSGYSLWPWQLAVPCYIQGLWLKFMNLWWATLQEVSTSWVGQCQHPPAEPRWPHGLSSQYSRHLEDFPAMGIFYLLTTRFLIEIWVNPCPSGLQRALTQLWLTAYRWHGVWTSSADNLQQQLGEVWPFSVQSNRLFILKPVINQRQLC